MKKNIMNKKLVAERHDSQRWESYCDRQMDYALTQAVGFEIHEAPCLSYYLDDDGNPVNVRKVQRRKVYDPDKRKHVWVNEEL